MHACLRQTLWKHFAEFGFVEGFEEGRRGRNLLVPPVIFLQKIGDFCPELFLSILFH